MGSRASPLFPLRQRRTGQLKGPHWHAPLRDRADNVVDHASRARGTADQECGGRRSARVKHWLMPSPSRALLPQVSPPPAALSLCLGQHIALRESQSREGWRSAFTCARQRQGRSVGQLEQPSTARRLGGRRRPGPYQRSADRGVARGVARGRSRGVGPRRSRRSARRVVVRCCPLPVPAASRPGMRPSGHVRDVRCCSLGGSSLLPHAL